MHWAIRKKKRRPRGEWQQGVCPNTYDFDVRCMCSQFSYILWPAFGLSAPKINNKMTSQSLFPQFDLLGVCWLPEQRTASRLVQTLKQNIEYLFIFHSFVCVEENCGGSSEEECSWEGRTSAKGIRADGTRSDFLVFLLKYRMTSSCPTWLLLFFFELH